MVIVAMSEMSWGMGLLAVGGAVHSFHRGCVLLSLQRAQRPSRFHVEPFTPDGMWALFR
jgi:hypothetical protein